MITEFDPTKKASIPQRPMGQIVIQYDPNSGRLGFQSQGLLPVEELGVCEWYKNIRMAEFMKASDQKQVMVVPAGSVPNVKGN